MLTIIFLLALHTGLQVHGADVPCFAYDGSVSECSVYFDHTDVCRYVHCAFMEEPMVPPGYRVLLGANNTFSIVRKGDSDLVFNSGHEVYVEHLFVHWSTTAIYKAHAWYQNGEEDPYPVSYSLLDSPDFRINARSGDVFIDTMPAHDTRAQYNFTVRATDTAGNSTANEVTFQVCEPFHTSDSQCTHDELPAVEQQQEAAKLDGHYVAASVNGKVEFTTVGNTVACQDIDAERFEMYIARTLGVPPQNVIQVECRGPQADSVTLTLDFTLTTNSNKHQLSQIADGVQNHANMRNSLAAGTGLPPATIHIESTGGAVLSHPSHRADYYHTRYRRVSNVWRKLTFPIPDDIGMTGVGTREGELVVSPDKPILKVQVKHLPTEGVTGCRPLMSFYGLVRDKLVSTLDHAVKVYERNTGDQEELEGLRTDIETAQKDMYSLTVFCGDLAALLRVRRKVFHAYTSAWADMKFGNGELKKAKYPKRHGSAFLSHSRPGSVSRTKHVDARESFSPRQSWRAREHKENLWKDMGDDQLQSIASVDMPDPTLKPISRSNAAATAWKSPQERKHLRKDIQHGQLAAHRDVPQRQGAQQTPSHERGHRGPKFKSSSAATAWARAQEAWKRKQKAKRSWENEDDDDIVNYHPGDHNPRSPVREPRPKVIAPAHEAKYSWRDDDEDGELKYDSERYARHADMQSRHTEDTEPRKRSPRYPWERERVEQDSRHDVSFRSSAHKRHSWHASENTHRSW